MCVPEGVVSLIAWSFCHSSHDGALADGGQTGVVDGIARATLDESWVSPLLLVIDLLNTLYLYGH